MPSSMLRVVQVINILPPLRKGFGVKKQTFFTCLRKLAWQRARRD